VLQAEAVELQASLLAVLLVVERHVRKAARYIGIAVLRRGREEEGKRALSDYIARQGMHAILWDQISVLGNVLYLD
jgi:hypothetical protein